MSRTLTICPARSGGVGSDPTVATVSSVKRNPCQSDTLSVSEYAIDPATWTATIAPISTARRRRNGSNSPRSPGPSKLLKRLRRSCLSVTRAFSGCAGGFGDRGVGRGRVIGAENGRAGDEQAGPGGCDSAGGAGVDATVNLDAPGADHLAEAADLVGRVGDEGLAAPARVDRHAEEDVGVVHRLAHGGYG